MVVLDSTLTGLVPKALDEAGTNEVAVNRTNTKKPKLFLQTKSLAVPPPSSKARRVDSTVLADITPTTLNTHNNTWRLTQLTTSFPRCTEQIVVEPPTQPYHLSPPVSTRSILKNSPRLHARLKADTRVDPPEPTRSSPLRKPKRVSFKSSPEEIVIVSMTMASEAWDRGDDLIKLDDNEVGERMFHARDPALHKRYTSLPSLKRQRRCKQKRQVNPLGH